MLTQHDHRQYLKEALQSYMKNAHGTADVGKTIKKRGAVCNWLIDNAHAVVLAVQTKNSVEFVPQRREGALVAAVMHVQSATVLGDRAYGFVAFDTRGKVLLWHMRSSMLTEDREEKLKSDAEFLVKSFASATIPSNHGQWPDEVTAQMTEGVVEDSSNTVAPPSKKGKTDTKKKPGKPAAQVNAASSADDAADAAAALTTPPAAKRRRQEDLTSPGSSKVSTKKEEKKKRDLPDGASQSSSGYKLRKRN